jgi:tetratricopeptide (TPR) repeat protein
MRCLIVIRRLLNKNKLYIVMLVSVTFLLYCQWPKFSEAIHKNIGASLLIRGIVSDQVEYVRVSQNFLQRDNCPDCSWLLGQSLLVIGNYDDASETLRSDLVKSKRKELSALMLGRAYEEIGAHQSAVTVWQSGATASYFVTQGREHLDMGNYEEAEESFLQAIEINPEFADAYAGLGWTYERLYAERYQDTRLATEQVYLKLITLEGDSRVRGWLGLARAYDSLVQLEKEITVLQRGLQVAEVRDPDSRPEFLLWLGRAYRRSSLWTESMACLAKALKLTQDTHCPNLLAAKLWLELGITQMDRSEPDSAMICFHQALRCASVEGFVGEVYGWIGRVYLQVGKPQEAITSFRRATMHNPYSKWWYLELGAALSDAGLLEEAQSAYEQVLVLDPRDQHALEALKEIESEQR